MQGMTQSRRQERLRAGEGDETMKKTGDTEKTPSMRRQSIHRVDRGYTGQSFTYTPGH